MGAMRKAGAVVVPALAIGAGVGVVGPVAPAGAQVPLVPTYGDLTGDGIADRVVFPNFAGFTCRVTVEPGLAGGGYGPAENHDYAFPPPVDDASPCPNRGAIVDLGGDGVNELVAAWPDSNSCPYGSTEPCPQLLVLRDYEVVQQYYDTNVTSGGIGTADLDGDGLVDIYRSVGNDEGFFSMLNTPAGELVPGPLEHNCIFAGNTLVDVNENGKLDLLVEHDVDCEEFGYAGEGIGVMLDDGTGVVVATGGRFNGEVTDVNGDGHVDIVARRESSSVAVIYLGDGLGGFTPK